MNAFFQDIFQYTHSSNAKLIEVILANPKLYSEKISSLTSHILNAHHIWNNRIVGKPSSFSVWELLDINQLSNLNDKNFEDTKQLIQNKNFTERINYRNSKGLIYTNTAQEIFFHIINHSTYHRGQLISFLKSNGVEPIVTDYIFLQTMKTQLAYLQYL